MTTKLDKSLKRELDVNGVLYTLTISPEGLKLVPKGKRNGQEHSWKDLVGEQTATAGGYNSPMGEAGD
jgi:hypothetical protein